MAPQSPDALDRMNLPLRATLSFRRRQALRMSALLFGIVLAALVGAIAVVAGAIVFSEQDALDREAALLDRAVAQEQRRLLKELERFAVSSATYRSVATDYSSEWVHTRIAEPLSRIYQHDVAIVLNRQRLPLFAYVEDFIWLPSIYNTKLETQLGPLVKSVQDAFQAALVERKGHGFAFDGEADFIGRSAIVMLDDRPAIASIFAIAPEPYDFIVSDAPPSVLVSLRYIDEEMLASLSEFAQLPNIHLSEADTGEFQRLPLRGSDGQVLCRLAWRPAEGASQRLVTLTPVFGISILIILGVTGVVLSRAFRASEELTLSEARSRQAALHDPLSGLPNRVYFDKLARERISSSVAEDQLCALLYLDIDHFKEVNDTLGHPVGDALIMELGNRLRQAIASGDVVARISGDEFLILLVGRKSREEVIAACSRLIEKLTRDLVVDGNSLPVTVSMGVTFSPSDGTDLVQLLRRADIALYQAKDQGRNRCIVFEQSMDDALNIRRKLEAEMRRALEHDEFFLNYQPVVSRDGRRMVGVEALIRWRHPDRGELPPGAFLPVAEGSDLMWQIGAWVLKTAMRDALAWPQLTVAVNVSTSQLRHPDFVSYVRRTLTELNYPASHLELEVTEAVLMDHTAIAKRTFSELHGLGLRIALDDFGTGFSSLSYLRQFHFDKFKIDRSFVTNVETESESAAIVRSLVGLGEALGMTITAEGIETETQFHFLQTAGCDYMQGYYFGRPMAAAKISERLAGEALPHSLKNNSDTFASAQPGVARATL